MNFFVLTILSIVVSVTAFSVSNKLHAKSFELKAIPDNTFIVAELYSGPAATYNGELISESLKAVPAVVQKPAGLYLTNYFLLLKLINYQQIFF